MAAPQLYNVFQNAIVRDQLIANTVLAVLATTMVVMRFVSRRIRESHIWWDDVCCVLSLLHTYGMLAMHYHYARVGMREHITEIPMQNTIFMLKMLIVYQIVYYNAMVLAKLSYLFFYLRIFVTEAFRLAAWICMGCALSYWLGSMLQIFLICQPFAKNWDPTLEGHCASQNVAFSTIGAFNLVTDLLIMLLPVHFIRKLQMSPATKLGLYMVFGLGFFISAITIIRIHVLTTVDFTDLPYSMIWAAFWSVAEPALAVTNACIPMMRPVLKAFFPNLFGSARDADHTSETGPSVGSSLNFHKRRNVDDLDGEMPLTQLQDGPGKWSRSGDEMSLNGGLQEGHSATHLPRSVIEN